MKITATFLDEISHDIPHQNWGRDDWDRDFRSMKAIGIDTVVLIRCGHKRWMTYPSDYLITHENGYRPPVDLVDLFLDLSEKYGMAFFFGTYDSGKYWVNKRFREEIEADKAVCAEAWSRYGHRKAFKGWYLNQEVSLRFGDISELYADMGAFCKEISGGLPTMISPYIQSVKAVNIENPNCVGNNLITIEQHEAEWNAIFSAIRGVVDIVAFQDGHCDYDELPEYLRINRSLAERYNMHCWTNCESFDRDMPWRFPPIKWEKMLLKLEAAKAAGIEKAITFEFSHFMSPNSCYLQAPKLFERYCEHFQIDAGEFLK